MKPNIDFFPPRAKKPTFNIPTKMFDPSKTDIGLNFQGIHRHCTGCTKSGLIGVVSKIHVQ